MMHTYRWLFSLNGHRNIAAVEVIECRDDGMPSGGRANS